MQGKSASEELRKLLEQYGAEDRPEVTTSDGPFLRDIGEGGAGPIKSEPVKPDTPDKPDKPPPEVIQRDRQHRDHIILRIQESDLSPEAKLDAIRQVETHHQDCKRNIRDCLLHP